MGEPCGRRLWPCPEGLIKRIEERIDICEHSGHDETSTHLHSDMLKMIRGRITIQQKNSSRDSAIWFIDKKAGRPQQLLPQPLKQPTCSGQGAVCRRRRLLQQGIGPGEWREGGRARAGTAGRVSSPCHADRVVTVPWTRPVGRTGPGPDSADTVPPRPVF